MTTHSPSIDRFCEEICRDPIFGDLADSFRAGLSEVDRLADDSPDHAEFFAGLEWIFSTQSRSVGERLAKMSAFGDLIKDKGRLVVVDLPRFTGW
jgi:hypothetical protein